MLFFYSMEIGMHRKHTNKSELLLEGIPHFKLCSCSLLLFLSFKRFAEIFPTNQKCTLNQKVFLQVWSFYIVLVIFSSARNFQPFSPHH